MLHTLARLGTGFDCASADEIDKILSMGISLERIIFANPTKMEAHILHAKDRGVKRCHFSINITSGVSYFVPE